VDLNTSFRSTRDVLEYVDAVFDHPERTRALVGVEADIPPHLPARDGQAGCVELWPLFTDPEKVEKQAWSAPVDQESEASGRKKLARALAREIRDQVANGSGIWDFDKARGAYYRPARYGDYLVLVRRRDATFEEIIRALKMEGVPVAGADRLKLDEHIVFDDLLALARFALFPSDDLSLAEILRSPFCDVPDFGEPHDLYHLAETGTRGRQSLWGTLQARKDTHPQWREAHDLLQETYVAAWLAVRRYDPTRPFDVWLRSIALNKCRDWSRRRAVRRVVRGVMGLDAPEATTVSDDTPTPEVRLDDLRRVADLKRALADLPDGLKAPLLLATLEGRSHAEIATILGVTPKAVETRIARARKKLSEVLARQAERRHLTPP